MVKLTIDTSEPNAIEKALDAFRRAKEKTGRAECYVMDRKENYFPAGTGNSIYLKSESALESEMATSIRKRVPYIHLLISPI